jgi:hypothetical protein
VACQGGAYRGGLIDNWLRKTLRPEQLQPALDLIRDHETFDDWWKMVDLTGGWVRDTGVAGLLEGDSEGVVIW